MRLEAYAALIRFRWYLREWCYEQRKSYQPHSETWDPKDDDWERRCFHDSDPLSLRFYMVCRYRNEHRIYSLSQFRRTWRINAAPKGNLP